MNSVWSWLPICRGGELWAVWASPKRSHQNNPINNGVRRPLDAMTRWARAPKSMGGLAPVLIRPGFQPVSFGLSAAHWERGQPQEERGWPAGRGSSRISPQQQLPLSWRSKSDEPHVSAQRKRWWDTNHNKQTQAPIFFFPPLHDIWRVMFIEEPVQERGFAKIVCKRSNQKTEQQSQ